MQANLCCYVCQNMRNMTFALQPTTNTGRPAPSRMPRHTQYPEHTSTSSPNQPICIVTHAATYATQQISHRQRPSPVDLHHHACQDIHCATDTPQSAATGRHHYNLRMPGHTQPPATARGGGSDTGTHASTGTTASPDRQARSITSTATSAAASLPEFGEQQRLGDHVLLQPGQAD